MSDEPGGVTAVGGLDQDMDSILAQVQALRELAADPDKTQDSARVYDFSIRWGTMLSGRLERVEHYHRRGELAADQQERYAEVTKQLAEVLPLAERLGLGRPTIEVGR